MISLHHAETDNTNTPLSDNESANAETFPYNETEKVTAVLKGGKQNFCIQKQDKYKTTDNLLKN